MRALSTAPRLGAITRMEQRLARPHCRGGLLAVPLRHRSMRTERRSPGLAAAPAGQPSNPRLEITPTLSEYRQLCRDLRKLRKLGAPSHTQAIVSAVHAAASANLASGERQGAGRR